MRHLSTQEHYIYVFGCPIHPFMCRPFIYSVLTHKIVKHQSGAMGSYSVLHSSSSFIQEEKSVDKICQQV